MMDVFFVYYFDGDKIEVLAKTNTSKITNLPIVGDYWINPRNKEMYMVKTRVFDPKENVITIILTR